MNGPHILFATTEAASAFSSQVNSGPVLTAHGVSPFVTVNFNNLIQGISFSQPSFDPTLGETQNISAYFGVNCDWTLNVVDIYTNLVFTTNGTGGSLSYDWDGNGNGGTSIAPGVYFYTITAATNGLALPSVDESGGSGGSSPPTPEFESSELWAADTDSETVVPLAIYPPGFDTNGLTIFPATPAEVRSLTATTSARRSVHTSFTLGGGGGATPDDAGAGGGSSQTSPNSPQRPPANPVRGLVGSIGIAADTYGGNGTNGPSTPPLDNGLHIGQHIQMESFNAGSSLSWPPRPEHQQESDTFVKTMQYYGWSTSFKKIDPTQLSIGDLQGSGTPFNSVNMGVLILHGTYGNSIDYAANGCKQMYYAVASGGGSAAYLRLSDMNLGGAGTNGLKWMVIDACHSLYHVNWSSMNNKGIHPYNGNLHLLLGGDTTTWSSVQKWYNFAKYINFGKHKYANPWQIRDGYYQANIDAFQNAALPSGTVVTLAVAGDSACLYDTLATNAPPSGSWQYGSLQIYPY